MDIKQVKDIQMLEPVIRVQPNTVIIDLVKTFTENPASLVIFVVDKDDKLLGLISRKMIFQTVFSQHIKSDKPIRLLFKLLTAEVAGEIMITEIVTTTPEESIDDLIKKMVQHNFYQIPLVDSSGHLLGLVSAWRLLQIWLLNEENKSRTP
jgi:CBS domain-containing protein